MARGGLRSSGMNAALEFMRALLDLDVRELRLSTTFRPRQGNRYPVSWDKGFDLVLLHRAPRGW